MSLTIHIRHVWYTTDKACCILIMCDRRYVLYETGVYSLCTLSHMRHVSYNQLQKNITFVRRHTNDIAGPFKTSWAVYFRPILRCCKSFRAAPYAPGVAWNLFHSLSLFHCLSFVFSFSSALSRSRFLSLARALSLSPSLPLSTLLAWRRINYTRILFLWRQTAAVSNHSFTSGVIIMYPVTHKACVCVCVCVPYK